MNLFAVQMLQIVMEQLLIGFQWANINRQLMCNVAQRTKRTSVRRNKSSINIPLPGSKKFFSTF